MKILKAIVVLLVAGFVFWGIGYGVSIAVGSYNPNMPGAMAQFTTFGPAVVGALIGGYMAYRVLF